MRGEQLRRFLFGNISHTYAEMASRQSFSRLLVPILNRSYCSQPKPFLSIPAPKGLPFIGTLLDVIKAGGVTQIYRYIDERHRQLGPIFREKLGHVEALWLADPKLYKQVYQQEGTCPRLMLPEPWAIFNKKHGYQRGLFFMQGEEWYRYRKLLNPLLMKMTELHRHLESLEKVADQLLEKWNPNNLDGKGSITQLEQDLYCYFVQGLICSTFGSNIGLNRTVVDKFVPDMVRHLKTLFEQSARLTLIPPSLAAKWKLNVWREFERAALSALETSQQLTDFCLNQRQNGKDREADVGLVDELQRQNVPHSDIQRIVVDLFLAAADTTSHTMQWVFYLLAQHPEAQERAAAEIAQGVGWQTGAGLMKGAVKEALRLYPVATFLTRIIPQESVIGGYSIPAETLVLMSIYSSGRNNSYFPNANLFMPERWNRNETKNEVMDPYASLPFGHGKRACIGRRLAEAQMYILLHKALPRLIFRVDNNVEMVSRLLGTVDQPVQLRVERRV